MADRRNRQSARAGSRPSDTPEPNTTTVKLRPVAGLAPTTYLPILYAAAVLGVLFLVLVLPGLRSSGSLVTFSSTPGGAAVEIDGRFAGTTPVTARVAAGSHTVTFSKTHFHAHDAVVEVGGRLLFSAFAARRASYHAALQVADAAAAVDAALLDLAHSPRIARIITDAAGDLTAPDVDPAAVQRFLRNALYLVEDDAGLAALVAAHTRAAAAGGLLSPLGLQQTLHRFAQLAAEYPTWPLWLSALLSSAEVQRLAESPAFGRFMEHYVGDLQRSAAALSAAPAPAQQSAAEAIEVAGLRFLPIPAGAYLMGDVSRTNGSAGLAQLFEEWPHPITLGGFHMQEHEVTKQAYARFVAEVPAWAPANRAGLLADGLVAEDYLADWVDGAPPPGREREPVVYVSAHAAEAFAAWLSQRVPPTAAGGRLRARLPFEPEWEFAARGGLAGQPYPRGEQADGAHLAAAGVGLLPVGQSPANGYGLRDLLGSVWEWTGDWYSPTRYLLARDFAADYQTDLRFRVGSRRVVRGGSFANDPRVVKLHTRGSQPAAWCTPVLGFRLVLVDA